MNQADDTRWKTKLCHIKDRRRSPEPGKPWLSRQGRRIDFAERDAPNGKFSKPGEDEPAEHGGEEPAKEADISLDSGDPRG